MIYIVYIRSEWALHCILDLLRKLMLEIHFSFNMSAQPQLSTAQLLQWSPEGRHIVDIVVFRVSSTASTNGLFPFALKGTVSQEKLFNESLGEMVKPSWFRP